MRKLASAYNNSTATRPSIQSLEAMQVKKKPTPADPLLDSPFLEASKFPSFLRFSKEASIHETIVGV
jgi:hypothetical protein